MTIDHDGAQIAKLLDPFVVELLRISWDDANGVLGIDGAFDLEMVEVQEVRHLLLKKAKGIPETTEAQMRAMFGEAARDGHGNDWIADRIQEYHEMSKARALMIARTESATAYEAGSHLRWQQSGMVSGSEWLLGPEPCPECQPLGGKVVALGEEFADGAEYPPLHPNCTCATAAVLSE